MEELLHGESNWLEGTSVLPQPRLLNIGIESEEEEQSLHQLNNWVKDKGLTQGKMAYEFTDPESGDQQAIFDLAWPAGLQQELSQPVAVLINEGAEILSFANRAGFRCFTSVESFMNYALSEILKETEFEQARIEI